MIVVVLVVTEGGPGEAVLGHRQYRVPNNYIYIYIFKYICL